MGRPQKKLTDEQIAEVETLAAILSQEQIADYFGIARNTFAAIVDREPLVQERYLRGKAKAIGAVAQGLLQQARKGNITAAIFYLKTQAGWRETSVIEGPGPNGEHTVNHTVDLSKAPPELLEWIVAQGDASKPG